MGATKAVESKSEDDCEESEARDCERNTAVSARLLVLSVAEPYLLRPRPLLVSSVLLKPCCQHERQFFVFIVIVSFIFLNINCPRTIYFPLRTVRLQALNPQNSVLLLLMFCISSSFPHFWTLVKQCHSSLSVHHYQFYLVLCSLYVTQFTTHRQVSLAFCPCLQTY